MFTPPQFREDRLPVLQQAMRDCGMATLVTNGPGGLLATHLPVILDPEPAPYGTLIGHVAAGNPHANADGDALAIFLGPNAYVSPNWYPTKHEHGRVVPTWNYVAVHAYGTLRSFDDPARLRDLLDQLTDSNEQHQDQPWRVSDAPEDFVADMLGGIVGIEMPITRLEGKRKMSQNRPDADRIGVIQGLRASDSPHSNSVADIVEEIFRERDGAD